MGITAGVADDDDVVVMVSGRIDRRGDADVDGAAGDNDRVDATGA